MPGEKVKVLGYGWAPMTWMSAHEADYPDPLSRLAAETDLLEKKGLLVQYPGFLLHTESRKSREQILGVAQTSTVPKFTFPVDDSLLEWYSVSPADSGAKIEHLDGILAGKEPLAIILSRAQPKASPPEIGLLVEVYSIDDEEIQREGDDASRKRYSCQIIRRVHVWRETAKSYLAGPGTMLPRDAHDNDEAAQAGNASDTSHWRIITGMFTDIEDNCCVGEALSSTQKWIVDSYQSPDRGKRHPLTPTPNLAPKGWASINMGAILSVVSGRKGQARQTGATASTASTAAAGNSATSQASSSATPNVPRGPINIWRKTAAAPVSFAPREGSAGPESGLNRTENPNEQRESGFHNTFVRPTERTPRLSALTSSPGARMPYPALQEDTSSTPSKPSNEVVTQVGQDNTGEEGHLRVRKEVELLKIALSSGNIDRVEFLLRFLFDDAAQGEFSWLVDLKETGFTISEMTKILFDAAKSVQCSLQPTDPQDRTEAPESLCPVQGYSNLGGDLLDVGFPLYGDDPLSNHQRACAHRIPEVGKALQFDALSHTAKRSEMQKNVAALCGLAGLIPGDGQDNGPQGLTIEGSEASVVYQGNLVGRKRNADDAVSSSQVTYLGNPNFRPCSLTGPSMYQGDLKNSIKELKGALSRLEMAVVSMQRAGFCCNEFTIPIEAHDIPGSGFPDPVVRLKTILFRDFGWLNTAIEGLSGTDENSSRPPAPNGPAPSIDDILKVASESGSSAMRHLCIQHRLQLCSLAIQVLNMGVFLYSQAYTGLIHPFFLTRPLTAVSLYGVTGPGAGTPVIVERRRLACLGDMLGDQVFVFRTGTRPGLLPCLSTTERLYLSGSCAQIADLWGPGYTLGRMKPSSGFYMANIVGFYIRGGIIRTNSPPGQVPRLFHWAPEPGGQTASPQTFSYWNEILIGTTTECQFAPSDDKQGEETSVTNADPLSPPTTTSSGSQIRQSACIPLVMANKACPLNPIESRKESEPSLCTLGTSSDWWSLTEIQGMAATNAPYFTLQGAFSMTKQSGIPLKRVLLDRWIGDENLSLFDEPWGLRVSLCTGVAQRVPLRTVIEDPLINLIDSLGIHGWEKIKSEAEIAFRAESPNGFSTWAAKLPPGEKQCMRTVCNRLLHVLKNTGFDSSGKHFSILWPYEGNATFCVRIRPEKDKDQLWCSMLQDSEWCASFAVITNQCLQIGAGTDACRKGVVAPWRGGALLSTTVCPSVAGGIPRSPKGTSTSSGPLNQINQGMQTWKLQPNKQYWVGKQGSQIWVVVRKGAGFGVVTELQVRKNRFPTATVGFLWPDRVLREKPDVSFRGEDVFVMHR